MPVGGQKRGNMTIFDSKWPIAALLAAALGMQACTTNPATGEQSFTAFMSESDEKKVGAEEHPKILEQFGGTYSDEELAAYVREIGRKLVAKSEYADQQFQFFVLNDDIVNAFALPGGYIYISRGLIALCEDEAELAGVIGHEIGHVTARHTAQRYSTAVATNIGIAAVGILGSVLGAPSGATNVLAQGAGMALQSYSRSQELQADQLGARYMSAAGYDPHALTDFFTKLDVQTGIEAKKAGKPKDNFSIMSTHPRTADRITQARELATINMPANPVRHRDAMLTNIDGLVFGKDPKEGFMKGDTFIHPDLDFKFTVPPDFKVDNGKTAVTASNDKGTIIIFNMESPKAATGMPNLVTYVQQHWAPALGVKPGTVEKITVNGMDGATTAMRVDTTKGARDLRLVAIRAGREQIFRFQFLTEPNVTRTMSDPLQRVTYSFNKLAPGEADNVQPPHIRVHKVAGGETINGLASSMPLKPYNDDWFRALNLNVISDGLAAGERVKLVGN